MKIIKPDTFSLVRKGVDYKNEKILLLTMPAAFRFSAPDTLLDEGVVWECTQKELGKETIFDNADPKPNGEVLLGAWCFAPEGRPVQSCPVSFRVGGLRKTLIVLGDRRWLNGGGLFDTMTDPAFFTRMEISPERAFGGAGYSLNPFGIGMEELIDSEGKPYLPLPNIEYPDSPIRSPKDRPSPAIYLPMHFDQELLNSLAGTYDEEWRVERWPAIADDMNFDILYSASPDQRLKGYLQGGEEIELLNMHPDFPLLKTRLPRLRLRLFVERSLRERIMFDELETWIDTLWLFPHLETGIVIWRSLTLTADEENSDIKYIVSDVEHMDTPPRETDYYKAKIHPPQPAPKPEPEEAPKSETSDAPAPLVPPAEAPKPPDPEAEKLLAEIKAKQKALEDELNARLKELGIDPSLVSVKDAPVAATPLTSLAPEELLARINADLAAKQEELNSLLGGLGINPAAVPEITAAELTINMSGIIASLKAAGIAEPELFKELEGLEKTLATSKKAVADALKQADELKPEKMPKIDTTPPPPAPPSDLTREDVLGMYARGESFDGIDLTGVDLSKTELPGIDLSGAILVNTVFSDATLKGAKLDKAIAPGADFSGANLEGASLKDIRASGTKACRAVFSGADLSAADFNSADFTGGIIEGAKLDRGNFEKTILNASSLMKCSGKFVRFVKASACESDFSQSTLIEADFSGAILDKGVFSDCDLSGSAFHSCLAKGALFNGAIMKGCKSNGESKFSGSAFSRADFGKSTWSGCDFSKGDFRLCNLTTAKFRKCDLKSADFMAAHAHYANFSDSDLSRAMMKGINLFKGSLRKARLLQTDLSDANLFAVDLYKAVFSNTNMRRTILQRTVLENYTPMEI